MRKIMIMKWDGVTPDQYEQLRKIVNWEGNVPQGCIFHAAAFSNNGIRVNDIWESEDDFNNFVQNRLMPGVRQLGVTGQPEVEMLPVHAVFAPDVQALVSSPSYH